MMQANPVESCNASHQEGAIIWAIANYINAGRHGDNKIARKVFANAAAMPRFENNLLKTVPIQEFYAYFGKKPRNAPCEISVCSVSGDLFMVRVESVFDDARFTDMFTPVKDGNGWKIVSKVYHRKSHAWRELELGVFWT